MKKWNVAVLFLLILSLSGCGYNQIQSNEEAVFAAWGNLEAALQRRADLIPNLVETVKGYAAHEKTTLESVMEARSKATSVRIDAKGLGDKEAMAKFQAAQGELSSALARLLAVSENYPNLKASEQFLALMNQLEGTENRINVARQRYNEAVQVFNLSIRTFPESLTNNFLLHLDRKEFFAAEPAAKQAPKVNFGTGQAQ